jgi:hypothetical protein
MATLFEKIKKALGFYPKASYYKVEEKTGEPIKVVYTPAPEPVPEPTVEEPAIDDKDDGIDLASMTRSQLVEFATARGISVGQKDRKQVLIDKINAAL